MATKDVIVLKAGKREFRVVKSAWPNFDDFTLCNVFSSLRDFVFFNEPYMTEKEYEKAKKLLEDRKVFVEYKMKIYIKDIRFLPWE